MTKLVLSESSDCAVAVNMSSLNNQKKSNLTQYSVLDNNTLAPT